MNEQSIINPQVLYVVGAIVGTLITIVGFFISFYFKRSIASNDKLNTSVQNLQVSISGLNGIVGAMEDKYDITQRFCGERHRTIDGKLHQIEETQKEHSEVLSRHDRDISRVKDKLSISD